jgi:hypothetical protein
MAGIDFSSSVGILSGVKLSSSSQSLILDRMKSRYKDELQKQSEARSSVYEGQTKRAQEQSEKMGVVRGGLDLMVGYVGDSIKNAKLIKDTLFDMKVLLEKASRDPIYVAQEFDKKLTEINSLANDVPGSYNLIGPKGRLNYDARDIDMKTDEKGKTVTLNGQNVSSDYHIVEDGTGKKWVPEFFSHSIMPYTNYPTKDSGQQGYSTTLAASTTNPQASSSVMVRTDANYSSSSISYRVDGTDYTGTINKGGLGVTESWVYGRFSDAQGIAQAQADVKKALDMADMAVVTLGGTQAFVEGQYGVISNKIDEVNQQMTDAMVAQMHENYDFQVQLKTKYEGMISSLSSMMDMQANYKQLLSGGLMSGKKGGLIGSLFDASA